MPKLAVLLVFLAAISGCAVINHPAITATSYVVQGVRFYFSTLAPSEIVVVSTGTGETREKAIDNALIASVQQALGVLMVSEVTINNDQILNNIAVMYSAGVVNSFKVKGCTNDARISCEVTATVSPSKLQRKFASNSSTIEVDGNSLYSQHLTTRNAIIQRSRLTEYYFSGIRKYGLEPKLDEVKLIPSTTSNVNIEITLSISWNQEFKNNLVQFIKKLEQDTNGRKIREKDNVSITVRDSSLLFGPSFDTYYINPYSADFRKIIVAGIAEPILVNISPINHCEYIPAPQGDFFSNRFIGGNIFNFSATPIKIKLRGSLPPLTVKNIKKFTAQLGCIGHPQIQTRWSDGSSFSQPSPIFELPKRHESNFKSILDTRCANENIYSSMDHRGNPTNPNLHTFSI